MYTPNNYSNGFYNVGPYTPVQPIQQSQNTFAWIQGEDSARNYPVAPGNTVVLIDSDKPIMYMKTADLSGRPQPLQVRYLVSKDDYEKIQNGSNNLKSESEYLTKAEFEEKLRELDGRFVIRKGDRK